MSASVLSRANLRGVLIYDIMVSHSWSFDYWESVTKNSNKLWVYSLYLILSYITHTCTHTHTYRHAHSLTHTQCLPSHWLQELLWLHEILHSHLHDGPCALWHVKLLKEWVTQVDPQVLPILVHVAKAKVVPLNNTKRLAHLTRKELKLLRYQSKKKLTLLFFRRF